MKFNILDSKVQIPKTSDRFIVRKRLLDLFNDESFNTYIVRATMGYGKSVLLSQLAQVSKRNFAWFQIDEQDNNLFDFFTYFTLSLERVLNGGLDSFGFMDFINIDREQFKFKIINDFIPMLNSAAKKVGGINIVLDDCHLITNEDIIEMLKILSESVTSDVKFIITTRSMIPDGFVKGILSGKVRIIEQEDLCFNKDEVMQLVNSMIRMENTSELASQVYIFTEGWPAGIMLAIMSYQKSSNGIKNLNESAFNDKKLLKAYFASCFFAKLPLDVQKFISNTCIFDDVTPSLCDTVMGTHDSANMLQYLLSENVFITKVSQENRVYRYHSILKYLLEDGLKQKNIIDNYNKAALFYLGNKERKKAVELAMKTGNTDIIQYALEKSGEEMMENGDINSVEDWINYLFENNAVINSANRLVIAVYCIKKGDFEKAFKFADEADNMFIEAMDEQRHTKANIVKAIIYRRRNQYEEAIKTINTVITKLSCKNLIEPISGVRELVRCYYALGNKEKAKEICNQALLWSRKNKNTDVYISYSKILISINFFLGEYDRVIKDYNILVNDCPEKEILKRITDCADYVVLSAIETGNFKFALQFIESVNEKRILLLPTDGYQHKILYCICLMILSIQSDIDEKNRIYSFVMSEIKRISDMIASPYFYSYVEVRNEQLIFVDYLALKDFISIVLWGASNFSAYNIYEEIKDFDKKYDKQLRYYLGLALVYKEIFNILEADSKTMMAIYEDLGAGNPDYSFYLAAMSIGMMTPQPLYVNRSWL